MAASNMMQWTIVHPDKHIKGMSYTVTQKPQFPKKNILFATALARKLEKKGIKSYSLHPGVIRATGLTSGVDSEAWPTVGPMLESKKLEMPKEKNIEQGCATTIVAALDPALDGN
ncbi:hypothetical protein N7489_004552 [Penicillium chrysogenum]|uniref:uncharacterized protein n=1 Tax=Penicillium chrysogenum TaxID=5076 RepID=UPI0024DF0759|nr:uncharacterized protein N7489_004552 [Penicillium chrysogenum]KAJ5244456.1 hypothetical protein N7489_004552 [Penicillium chrysogenum]